MAESKIVERQKIKINKVNYFLDSLDENSQKILGDIRVVDEEMQKLQVSLGISGVAKNYLLEKLTENTEEFEKAPADEVEPDDDKTEATEDVRRLTEGDEGYVPEDDGSF